MSGSGMREVNSDDVRGLVDRLMLVGTDDTRLAAELLVGLWHALAAATERELEAQALTNEAAEGPH